jgi:hypothetical protein
LSRWRLLPWGGTFAGGERAIASVAVARPVPAAAKTEEDATSRASSGVPMLRRVAGLCRSSPRPRFTSAAAGGREVRAIERFDPGFPGLGTTDNYKNHNRHKATTRRSVLDSGRGGDP